jgi:CorA-like Mg2+ transporter protein
MRVHLKTPQNDLLSLTEYETHLSDKVQFLLDAVLGFVNTKQNDIFQALTVISVVGIPPTLVASIYGMNFRNMPELNWGWDYHSASRRLQSALLFQSCGSNGEGGCRYSDSTRHVVLKCAGGTAVYELLDNDASIEGLNPISATPVARRTFVGWACEARVSFDFPATKQLLFARRCLRPGSNTITCRH